MTGLLPDHDHNDIARYPGASGVHVRGEEYFHDTDSDFIAQTVV